MATNTAVHPTMEPGRRRVVLSLQSIVETENLPKSVEKNLLNRAIEAACGTSPVQEIADRLDEDGVRLRASAAAGFDAGRGFERVAAQIDAEAAALRAVIDPPQPEWFESA